MMDSNLWDNGFQFLTPIFETMNDGVLSQLLTLIFQTVDLSFSHQSETMDGGMWFQFSLSQVFANYDYILSNALEKSQSVDREWNNSIIAVSTVSVWMCWIVTGQAVLFSLKPWLAQKGKYSFLKLICRTLCVIKRICEWTEPNLYLVYLFQWVDLNGNKTLFSISYKLPFSNKHT